VWEHTLAVVEHTAVVIALVESLAAGATPEEASQASDPALAARPAEGPMTDRGDCRVEPLPADLAPTLAPTAAALAARLAEPLAADRPRRGHLLLAALFHDLGKPATRSVGADGRIHFYGHEVSGAQLAEARLLSLKLAQAEVQWVARMVRHHMRPLQLRSHQPLSARAIHRFHRAAAEVAPEVCLLSLADNLAKGGVRTHEEWPSFLPRVAELLDAYFFRHQQVVAPPRLLDGGELMRTAGLAAGPWVGEALAALAEAQAAGDVGSRDAAEAFARAWLDANRARLQAPASERQEAP
jgi:putative nucleotidyltransferase with HDIG domain